MSFLDGAGWERFCVSVDFSGGQGLTPVRPRVRIALPREREVRRSYRRLGNAQTAEASAQRKDVRNHVSNLFYKLGGWTRAQPSFLARDRGFKIRREG